MNHYTLEQWGLYARDEVSEEDRTAYEMHLGTCSSCLQLYMQSIDRAVEMYPVHENEAGMIDAVMNRIALESIQASPASTPPKNVQMHTKRRTPAFVMHPMFHYAVAAAITLILMSSGAFQSLTEKLAHLEPAAEEMEQEMTQATEKASVSHKIMEKTIVMLDSIQPKHEKGGAR